MLVELPARAPRLRRLLHRLLRLRLQPIERQDQFGERIDQRQAHQKEAQQNELEERARVVHALLAHRYNPPGIMTPHRTPRPLPALAIIAAVAATASSATRIGCRGGCPRTSSGSARLTTGHAVIMGRRTWESIGRALPGRQNIVVTRQPGYAAAGAEVAASLEAALALVTLPDPAFCIGGGELYRVALPHATALYLTEIHQAVAGDASFPAVDRTAWRETSRIPGRAPSADGLTCDYVTYESR